MPAGTHRDEKNRPLPGPHPSPIARALACTDLTRESVTGGSDYSSGTIRRATMLMILISGLIAGPAVSL